MKEDPLKEILAIVGGQDAVMKAMARLILHIGAAHHVDLGECPECIRLSQIARRIAEERLYH